MNWQNIILSVAFTEKKLLSFRKEKDLDKLFWGISGFFTFFVSSFESCKKFFKDVAFGNIANYITMYIQNLDLASLRY